MATRGRPKSDQKRRQILDAAGKLFAEKGYEKTSLDEIAASAGVSKQTIYSHFKNKADLLREGVERRCREGLLTSENLDYSLPPEKFLREFADRFIHTLADDVPLRIYRLCLSESERHPEVGRSFYEAGPRLIMDAFSEYLRRATARGELRVQFPEIAAAQFIFMVHGKLVNSALLGGTEWPGSISNEEYTEHCWQTVLRAYCGG